LVGDSDFVVALGDTIIGRGGRSTIVSRLVDVFEKRGVDAVLAIEEVSASDVEQFGIVVAKGSAGETFELADIVEKPTVGDAPSNLSVAGRYVFSPVLFSYLDRTSPGRDGQIQLTDALRLMIAEGRRVVGVRLEAGERRYDIGDFESYFQTFVEFALADPRYGESLHRRLRDLIDRGREQG
jgi:UTP--glucose-1-phosphate uridylyltransferase